MTVSIGGYSVCDGTLSGGVAVSDLNARVNGVIDSTLPIGLTWPVFFDRIVRTLQVTFQVKRTHTDNATAELFILNLDNVIPSTGDIVFTTSGPSGIIEKKIANGKLVASSLIQHIGATTFHQYDLIGGPMIAL